MRSAEISDEQYRNIQTKALIQLVYRNLFKGRFGTGNPNLSQERGDIARNVIRMYYHYYEKTSLIKVIELFRKKYIVNETLLEGAGKEEKLGLGEVYNYIQDYRDEKPVTIFDIMKLHQLLFSKCPFPEGSGVFRTGNNFLPGSMVEIPSYGEVPYLIRELHEKVTKLLQEIDKPDFDIIKYIKSAIDVKAEIVRIHPFDDGNGRISRAFLNLLFKKAGIPPVYVKAVNKDEYGKAMNMALVDQDPNMLYNFYFFKILESIYELDIEPSLRPAVIAKMDVTRK